MCTPLGDTPRPCNAEAPEGIVARGELKSGDLGLLACFRRLGACVLACWWLGEVFWWNVGFIGSIQFRQNASFVCAGCGDYS